MGLINAEADQRNLPDALRHRFLDVFSDDLGTGDQM